MTYQNNKKQNLKYEKIPAKKAGSIPWDILLVYLISPYNIRRKGQNDPLIIKYLTITVPVTRCFEKVKYNSIQEGTKAYLAEQEWLYISKA